MIKLFSDVKSTVHRPTPSGEVNILSTGRFSHTWEYLVDLGEIYKVVKTKTFETNLQSLVFL